MCFLNMNKFVDLVVYLKTFGCPFRGPNTVGVCFKKIVMFTRNAFQTLSNLLWCGGELEVFYLCS